MAASTFVSIVVAVGLEAQPAGHHVPGDVPQPPVVGERVGA
jgi:hypothetical protein